MYHSMYHSIKHSIKHSMEVTMKKGMTLTEDQLELRSMKSSKIVRKLLCILSCNKHSINHSMEDSIKHCIKDIMKLLNRNPKEKLKLQIEALEKS